MAGGDCAHAVLVVTSNGSPQGIAPNPKPDGSRTKYDYTDSNRIHRKDPVATHRTVSNFLPKRDFTIRAIFRRSIPVRHYFRPPICTLQFSSKSGFRLRNTKRMLCLI
jgi:hypothetical protein